MDKRASKSSSKTSSKHSSPGNTLKSGNATLTLHDMFVDSQLEKVYDNAEVLLDDSSLLDLLCDKANDFEEFPALLFKFFYVHDKTHTLLRWALEKDINTLSPNELFRGETMATRLFYYQFFGDLGKRFLTSILSTLLQDFAELNHSVEIDSHRVGNSPQRVDTEANLKWILQKLNEFVARLQDSPDHCPLGLRESFLFLKDVVGNKVENSNVFIASVLFLRLICPCLVLPEEYGVLDNLGVTLTPHGKRGLVLASKLLQSAANNSLWEGRSGCELVNEFITQANPLIVQFASNLTDSQVITLGKKVIKASITPVSPEEVKQTCDSLKRFMSHYILHRNLKAEVDYKQKYMMAMNFYNSTEWKVAAAGPKKDDCEYHVSQMKQEGSNFFVCRYWGRYKAPFELVKEFVRDTNPEMTIDDRVSAMDVIEKYEPNHFDLYMAIKPVFPIAGRDFVLSRHNNDETPSKWMQLTYSIEREDMPVNKKHIRAETDVTAAIIERDPNDPEYTIYTYIYHVDYKGWIPAFLVNGASKDNLATLAKLSQKIMQLGKAPEENKKQKKDKKSKKEKN